MLAGWQAQKTINLNGLGRGNNSEISGRGCEQHPMHVIAGVAIWMSLIPAYDPVKPLHQ